EAPKTPKNVILLIGDGMGLSEVSASYFFKETPPNFERFNTVGLIKTSAADALITDSAASATAYATGISTYNGAISVNMQKEPITTILERLTPLNISTGIISTSSVMHATPASFYAHAASRRSYEEIAAFLPTSNIEFIAGGGKQYLNKNKREDKRDLFKELKDNGYLVETEKLPNSISNEKQVIVLADDGMPKMIDGRGDFLPNATKIALEKLSKNEKGFFLMVEGSQIDWGGHDNDADYLISELLDFDKTIGVALDFAATNGETLVIVTADHETGGFTLSADAKDYNKIKPTFSTGGHSATMVPVFAKGPGEEDFGGIFKNTALFQKMMAIFNK
ncbi:MAG: alkaline phosphatase, partial [Patiriisocius sp.]